MSNGPLNRKDTLYAMGYVALGFDRVEMEERAHARKMIRAGLMKYGERQGKRTVEWTDAGLAVLSQDAP